MWGIDHTFRRTDITPDPSTLAPLAEDLKGWVSEALTVAARPYGVTPDFTLDEEFRAMHLLDVTRALLVACDAAAVTGRWDEVWPILEAGLRLSQDLSSAPAPYLNYFIAVQSRHEILRWIAEAIHLGRLDEAGIARAAKIFSDTKAASKTSAESVILSQMDYQDRLIASLLAMDKETFEADLKQFQQVFLPAMQELRITSRGSAVSNLVMGLRIWLLSFDRESALGLAWTAGMQQHMAALDGQLTEPRRQLLGMLELDALLINAGPVLADLAAIRLREGAYPAAIPGLPKGLLYRTEGGGFYLYSVGKDGLDDGGRAEIGDDFAVFRPYVPPALPLE